MPVIINDLRRPAVRRRTGAILSHMTVVNRQIENATNPAAQTYTRKNFAYISRKWSGLFS
ncbi:hypothetical protein D5R55_30200 [Burkholderia cenocepacia]|uniref:Uncharacterized protein n=1 Tax=Burkholderia cenocepacia TaxID=95486 RepID=A0A3Q9FC87_9BURK|nr:hypothetical protein D5R55_30200 [Burkholderia cenocepacia]